MVHLLHCQGLSSSGSQGLGQDPPAGTPWLIITLQRRIPPAFSSVLHHVMSLTFCSFLGSLSVPEEGSWNPQRQWMCTPTGKPAKCLVLMCLATASLRQPGTWTQAWWKKHSSLVQEWQNDDLSKPLGIFGQKVWVSMENRSAPSTSKGVTVLLQLQGAEDTSKARFAM